MDTTVEIRWFAGGSPPDVLRQRFDALRASEPERRTDSYLSLPGTDDLGVKLRQGGDAFELKLRQRDFGRTTFAGAPQGNLERWQKWSFPVSEAARVPGLGLPPQCWIDVEKSRRQVTYRLGADGTASPVEGREGDGCSVELTILTLQGRDWWSVGFEAFGSEERLLDVLSAAVEAVFADGGAASALTGAHSCAFPAWVRTEAVRPGGGGARRTGS